MNTRDRVLIALMVFSFALAGTVVGVKVDGHQNGKRWWGPSASVLIS